MAEIDPNQEMYSVRFKEKANRKNKDDKLEVLRQVAGISDTNNVLDLVKEAKRTANSEIKNNRNISKDEQTIVDINLYDIPSVHIKLTKEQAAALRRHPDIRWVDPDVIIHNHAETTPWGISRVQGGTAVDATIRHRGYSVKVGMIDSGIDYNHVDLKPNYKGGVSFVTGISDPMDDNTQSPDCKTVSNTFHGTHTAGTVAAAINNANVVGVSPEAFLYAIKSQDRCGSGTATAITQAMVWADQNGMDVVNMSLGGPNLIQDWANAAQSISDHNRFLSVSTGNEGRDGLPHVNYPAGNPGAWGIGAVDSTDTLAAFSNWNTNPGYVDFVGPGVGVESDLKGGGTHLLDGTSMAAPHVSGIAAIAYANYRFSPCDTATYTPGKGKLIHIAGAMIASCDTLGQTSPNVQNNKYGFGMPQVGRMLDILLGQ